MDAPGQLIDLVRRYYLKRFAEAVIDETKSGLSAQMEQPVLTEDGTMALEGKLDLPMRLDLILIGGGEVKDVLRIETEGMLSFEPISFEWPNGLHIHLAPLRWETCRVRVAGTPVSTSWPLLKSWFNKWFDRDERNTPDEAGFFGVVHFLSDPQSVGGITEFEVDFGSAPMEAFEELLDALRKSGGQKVEISEAARDE